MNDATSLHHCLKNNQLKHYVFSSKEIQEMVYLVLCTLRMGVADTDK